MASNILVTEEIPESGLQAMRSRGYDVDVVLDLSPEDLIGRIGDYDALVVRSNTKVTSELLDAAKRLKIIGRSGVTIDNIDIDSANEHGVIVCNAPSSNTISAAEYTMSLILSAARNIAQANESMHKGEWNRRNFVGVELYGKTLAIFGLGRVGSLVAERAKAFGMNVIAYDPYCNPDHAAQLGAALYDDFESVLPIADVIALHMSLSPETEGMFGAKEFAAMKDGVIFVNAARSGLVDINALADFTAARKIRACGVDVYPEEPCFASPLHDLDNAIITPHISSLTQEAQIRAGEQIAEFIWAGLEGSIVPTAISSSASNNDGVNDLHSYIAACHMLGSIADQIIGSTPKNVTVELEGTLAGADSAYLIAGTVDGFLGSKNVGKITRENAQMIAERHGLKIRSTNSDNAQEYSSAVRIIADKMEIAATLYGLDQLPRIISFNGYKIDIAPAKESLIFEYVDGPGKIGVIGTILGDAGINITTMQIGTKPSQKCALVYINIEGEVSEEVMESLRQAIDLKNVWQISLQETNYDTQDKYF